MLQSGDSEILQSFSLTAVWIGHSGHMLHMATLSAFRPIRDG